MIVGKTYGLKIAELRWLVQLDEERNDTSDCHNCEGASDNCPSCQSAADLTAKLTDALSLAEAGAVVSFMVVTE